jgi:hypothetical protein
VLPSFVLANAIMESIFGHTNSSFPMFSEEFEGCMPCPYPETDNPIKPNINMKYRNSFILVFVKTAKIIKIVFLHPIVSR